ncbi:MAG: MBL fold metallo-hydrolase [Oscillospiraceae bacterium]|jgi:competence protein ComEC|nr:MBL fold metallo-hydrolase [Oscillospiraceae bacterium]
MKRKNRKFITKLCCVAIVCAGILGAIFVDLDDYASFRFRIRKAVSLQSLLSFFSIETSNTLQIPEAPLTIWEIDVGQGKSILIKSGDHAALIDAGDVEYGDRVLSFLKQKNIRQLDCVIITHPHADHVGGASTIANALPIGIVLLPEMGEGILPTTNIFGNFLNTLKRKKIKVHNPQKGACFSLGVAVLEICSAPNDTFDLNNASIVTNVKYQKFNFLSTGDIEAAAEEQLLENNSEFKVNVLDVAHHGGANSTGADFLRLVSPDVALISVGINDYGHPSAKVLHRLRAQGVACFCTSEEGTLQINVDENGYIVYNSKGSELIKKSIIE